MRGLAEVVRYPPDHRSEDSTTVQWEARDQIEYCQEEVDAGEIDQQSRDLGFDPAQQEEQREEHDAQHDAGQRADERYPELVLGALWLLLDIRDAAEDKQHDTVD